MSAKQIKHRIGVCVPGGSFMPQDKNQIVTPYDQCFFGWEACMNAGFDFAETAFGVFMSMSDEEFKRAVRDGVRFECANSFLPGEYALAKTELPKIREYVERAVGRAAAIGVDTVVFGSGRARSLPDGISYSERSALLWKYYEFIRMCGDIAASYGIKFALEPLNPAETNFMYTTIEGYAVASAVRHPAVKLLADVYHMSKQNEPLTNIPLVADKLVHVHVSEFDRSFPGAYDGTENGELLPNASDALSRAGYCGRVSCEAVYKDYHAELPRIYEYMRRVF
jgi:sugar phosphate isomerase/epimerase